jgi:hypothetical protein
VKPQRWLRFYDICIASEAGLRVLRVLLLVPSGSMQFDPTNHVKSELMWAGR